MKYTTSVPRRARFRPPLLAALSGTIGIIHFPRAIRDLRSLQFRRLAALLLAHGSLAAAAFAETLTWGNGGVDANWDTAGNWSGGTLSADDDLVFGNSSFSTTLNQNSAVTSFAGLTFNSNALAYQIGGASAMSLAGNITQASAQTQTLNTALAVAGARTFDVAAGGKLTVGSTGSTLTHSFNNGSSLFTGSGEVEYFTSSSGFFQVGLGNATGLDMSGLAKFTAEVGSFRIGNFTSITSLGHTVKLAPDSSITATTLLVGASNQNFTTEPTDTLRLGLATDLLVNNLTVGQKRNDGLLNFDGVVGAKEVTITGAAGGVSKTAVLMGDYNTTNTARTPTGNMNFTGGTVNAQLSTLVAGQVSGGSGTVNATGEGFWTMEAGTVTADTVRLGYYFSGSVSGTATTTARGTLAISGGSFTVGTALHIGDRPHGTTPSISRAIGILNASGGKLEVSGAFRIGNNTGGGVAIDQRGTLNITGTGEVVANVGITTLNARSTLILNGGTLDMKGNAIGTALQPVGGNGGALTFSSGTLKDVSEINGGLGALAKTGAGTLTLRGTNTFTGPTIIGEGTLAIGSGGSIPDSPLFDIQSAAALDVSALGGWTLGAGQTLMGNGTLIGATTTNGPVSPGASVGTLGVTGGFAFAPGSALNVEVDTVGTAQVETATAAGTAVADGNVDVTVTGAGITGSPIVLNVAILAADTAADWAAKVRAALAGDAAITAVYAVAGSDAAITLTALANTANDATLKIALADGTGAPGITPAPASGDTTIGTAPGTDLFAVSSALNVAGATLGLDITGTLTAPAYVIATYAANQLTGTFASIPALPGGYILDYHYNSNTAIAIKQAGGGPSPFATWIGDFSVGGETGLNDDPDNDGKPNFLEFALNSNPASGASGGKVFLRMATVGGVDQVLTLTTAVRATAAPFAADGNRQKALDPADSLTYLIEAANTLDDWGTPVVTEVTGLDAADIQAGLTPPAPEAGWIYKTFRTDGAASSDPGDFIRVNVTTP